MLQPSQRYLNAPLVGILYGWRRECGLEGAVERMKCATGFLALQIMSEHLHVIAVIGYPSNLERNAVEQGKENACKGKYKKESLCQRPF